MAVYKNGHFAAHFESAHLFWVRTRSPVDVTAFILIALLYRVVLTRHGRSQKMSSPLRDFKSFRECRHLPGKERKWILRKKS